MVERARAKRALICISQRNTLMLNSFSRLAWRVPASFDISRIPPLGLQKPVNTRICPDG
jgi:hypothetical protein